MEPKFSKIVSEQMALAAKKAYPNECCGILVGKKSEKGEIEVTEIREASNQFQGQKSVHFQIDPLFIYRLEQELESRGLEIVGVYHSHPDCPAILSKEDENYMVPGLEYVIMSVQKGEVVDVKSYRRDLQ
ncbi:MAG: M67 family metallopeptidase [Fibrobacter sp.]|nr:M67 family metallopeptidase [Fibrobacter sp.]